MGSMIPPYPACKCLALSLLRGAQLTSDIGADTSNDDLLSLGIEQWILESSALLDPSTNLYRHINDFDPYFWATGSGWMLHGGMRLLASIEEAGRTPKFSSQVNSVKSTMDSVFTALFDQLDVSCPGCFIRPSVPTRTDEQNNGLLPNYMLHWDASLGARFKMPPRVS